MEDLKNEFHKTREERFREYATKVNKQFEEMKEKFKNYKYNYVYYMEVSVSYYEDICQINKKESYVYSNFENALQEGKEYLELYINDILIENGLLNNEESNKQEIIEQEIENGSLRYNFLIEKVDPYYKDNFIKPEGPEKMVVGLEPSSTKYYLDLNGNEICKEIYFGKSKNGWAFVNDIFPGDEEKEAGTKFEVGDLVYDMDWKPRNFEPEEDRPIVMIREVPQRSDKYLFSNTYKAIGISKSGSLIPCYDHLQESKLKLYKKSNEIPKNSKWNLIREIVNHYDEISFETLDRLVKGEINFLDGKSFKNVNISKLRTEKKILDFKLKNEDLKSIYNVWNKALMCGPITFVENENTAVVDFYSSYEVLDEDSEEYLRRLKIKNIGYYPDFRGKAYEIVIENKLDNYKSKNGFEVDVDFPERDIRIVERSKLKAFFEEMYKEIVDFVID